MSTNPDPSGTFEMSSVYIRGKDVTGDEPFKNLSTLIRKEADLRKVYEVFMCVLPRSTPYHLFVYFEVQPYRGSSDNCF